MGHDFPAFEASPLLRNGHLQTIVGRYLPQRLPVPRGQNLNLMLGDGDQLRVVLSTPETWMPGQPVALIVHGLAGCAASPYVERLTYHLHRLGVRVARMNLRGAGEGFGLARGIYHGGRTGDLRVVVEHLANEAPGSPIAMVGFSLGAALVLKLAAEASDVPLPGLDCVLAANPPLDLGACSTSIRTTLRGIYDRNFVKSLQKEIARLHIQFPDLETADLRNVRSVREFDEFYTAPRNGFLGAEDYYQKVSAGPSIHRITVPGLVIHAEDDPFIPAESVSRFAFPLDLALEMIPRGGHLGFVSRHPWAGSHRWLEARLSVWLAQHWSARLPVAKPDYSSRHGEPSFHELRSIQ